MSKQGLTIAVVGSRSFTDYSLLEGTLDQYVATNDRIISGGAKGADSLAQRYAETYGIAFQCYPANWSLFGRSAGFKRNQEMVDAADAVIAFWDGQSNGTRHTIAQTHKAHKPVLIVRPNGELQRNNWWITLGLETELG